MEIDLFLTEKKMNGQYLDNYAIVMYNDNILTIGKKDAGSFIFTGKKQFEIID